MNFMCDKRLIGLVFCNLFISCGSEDGGADRVSSGNDRYIVGYPIKHIIASELVCSGTISTRNNTSIYSALGLNGTSSVFYEYFTDGVSTTTQVARVSSPTETFQVGRQYSSITATSSTTVGFDVLSTSNGGQWNFTQDAAGNVTFSYTDTDLSSTPEIGYCQTGLAVTVDATSDQLQPTYASQHGFANNRAVRVGSQTMPGGLSAETTFYVIVDSSGAFRLSSTKDSSQAVDITSNGTGVVIYSWNE